MSKTSFCYPNSIYSIRVAYILDDGKFIEDTAYFNIKSNINKCNNNEIKLFKDLNIDLTCKCKYEKDKVTLIVCFYCDICGDPTCISNYIDKLSFYSNKIKPVYDKYCCLICKKTSIIIEMNFNSYYRESDFIPREPYRDPNAPYEAAIFGAFFGTAAAFILGPAAIPVIGLSSWTAATGLSATAVLTGVLGGGGAISSYFSTLNSSDGKVCVNSPTINIGNCNGRDVNEIGVPIYLKASDYQHFDTNMTKSDLINKINNHPITTLIAQYPGLFKKT